MLRYRRRRNNKQHLRSSGDNEQKGKQQINEAVSQERAGGFHPTVLQWHLRSLRWVCIHCVHCLLYRMQHWLQRRVPLPTVLHPHSDQNNASLKLSWHHAELSWYDRILVVFELKTVSKAHNNQKQILETGHQPLLSTSSHSIIPTNHKTLPSRDYSTNEP